jgi:hypothetical protein
VVARAAAAAAARVALEAKQRRGDVELHYLRALAEHLAKKGAKPCKELVQGNVFNYLSRPMQHHAFQKRLIAAPESVAEGAEGARRRRRAVGAHTPLRVARLSRGGSAWAGGYPSGGVPPAVERQLHLLTYSPPPPPPRSGDGEWWELPAAARRQHVAADDVLVRVDVYHAGRPNLRVQV